MIKGVSFSGIYMIKFPKSYSDEQIKAEHSKLLDYVESKNYQFMNPMLRKNIKPQNQNQSTSDILLTTSIDNPNLIIDALSVINKDLADQYVDKTKVYLNVTV